MPQRPEPVALGQLVLMVLDVSVGELLDGAAPDAQQMVVVLAEAPEDPSGPPSRICKIISHTDMGFMSIDFPKIRSGFSPARGLDLLVPFALYIDGLKSRPGLARINVNTRTGVVTAR